MPLAARSSWPPPSIPPRVGGDRCRPPTGCRRGRWSSPGRDGRCWSGGTSAPTFTYTWNTSAKTLASVTDGATTTEFTYNSKGKVTEIDNNAGGVWTFTYASNGIDLTGISDSIGTVLTQVYGNSSLPHLPTSVTGADGRRRLWRSSRIIGGTRPSMFPPSAKTSLTSRLDR